MSTRAYRCRPLDRNVSILRSKRSISGPGARPSAVRRMTRRVIRRIVGRAGNGASTRPRPHGLQRLQPHRVEERPHPLALQGRDQDAALPRVRGPVEHQDRVPPDGRGEERVGLARVEHVRVAAEDLADGLRVGQHHEPAVAGDVEREGVAVAAVALVEQSERVAREADELPPGRGPGPGRECG